MKFTPNIDKYVAVHDASKKMHISFDDEPEAVPKKRSHPAHDADNDKKQKKSKVDKKEKKKDKKDKKEKKEEKKEKKEEKKEKKEEKKERTEEKKEKEVKKDKKEKKEATKVEPVVEKKPVVDAVPEKKAVSIDTPDVPVKVRGPKFTPKKVKAGKRQPPAPKSKEEILARVAAIRKKKQLKRNAKVTLNGEVITKSSFQLIPSGLPAKPLPTKDLGNFILLALSETANFPWCSIVNKAKINNMVMIFAQGLNSSDFGISEDLDTAPQPYVDLNQLDTKALGKSSMPFLCKQSKYMITHEISGSKGKFNSPVADILQCNMSNSKKETLLKEMNAKMLEFKDNMREYYVLSLEDLRKADFPIPPCLDSSVVLPEGWKQTHPVEGQAEPAKKKRIIAVDCEMVLTVSGSSLARITLIDEDGSVLLDELVKPDLPILDYLTKYSGITPAAMKKATCSLRRAQKHFRKIVTHDVILVGHGLENDLKALQICHPYCVDTSLLYDHHRGPPYKPSLRFLARTYLKRFIQDRNEEHVGHDSAEDARATLDLFKLKLDNKPRFGRFKYTELIMDRLSAHRPARTSAILESNSNDERSFGSTQNGPYFRVDNDEELVNLTLSKIKETNFLFTRYQAADGKKALDTYNQAPQIVPTAAKGSSERAVKLQKLDGYIRQVYEGLPENSFLVVTGGVSNIPQYKELYDKFRKFQDKSEDVKWTEEDQTLLCKYAAKARTSTSFFIFKEIAEKKLD